MKKILLATAAAAIISSSSAYAAGADTFYLKAGGDFTQLDGFKAKNKTKGQPDLKFKKSSGASVVLGAGYNVMDNARVDLTLGHLVSITFNGPKTKMKLNANVAMFNGFYDIFEITDGAKMFAGAGIGMSRVGGQYKGTDAALTGKLKDTYNFSFAGYAGVSYEITDGVDADLTYKYQHLGRTQKSTGLEGVEIKGHNVGAGVRFSI